MTRKADPKLDVDAWRYRYENNPMVTRQQIADDCGLSYNTVLWYTRTRGWIRGSEVKLEAMRKNAADARKNATAARETRYYAFTPPMAVPSIWSFAAGQYVSTTRSNGKHVIIEVPA